ncbi:MAG: phosphatidate cytidylyltransferase [Cardiobacteriaceae bacterium]|nr:phosphatidate cytidylyltransferase [Cardiobacteriaceae bacterium]
MLWQRVLTALIVAPLFFGILLCGSEPLQLGFWLLVMGLAAHELGKMFRFLGIYRWLYTGLVVLLCLAALLFSTRTASVLLGSVNLLWLVFVPYALGFYARKQRLPVENTLLALLGAFQLATFLLSIIILSIKLDDKALLSLFVVVWSADIGAYFVGRAFGKVPLAASISPKKTLEGFVGGLVVAFMLAGLADVFFDFRLPSLVFLLASALAIVYATIGDLWESVLKRRVGLKDSGNILPGHGGVMDRIDSWLSAFPIWAMALVLWGV